MGFNDGERVFILQKLLKSLKLKIKIITLLKSYKLVREAFRLEFRKNPLTNSAIWKMNEKFKSTGSVKNKQRGHFQHLL